MNSVHEHNLIDKIKTARELLDNDNKSENDYFLSRLKEVTDQAEIAYNEVKINRIKSYAALINLKDIENNLDELLKIIQ